MKIQVRYFASVREALGAGEPVEIPAGSSLGALRELLIARGGRHADMLGRGRALRMALDQRMTDEASVLAEGAEVAFFPPVTGG